MSIVDVGTIATSDVVVQAVQDIVESKIDDYVTLFPNNDDAQRMQLFVDIVQAKKRLLVMIRDFYDKYGMDLSTIG